MIVKFESIGSYLFGKIGHLKGTQILGLGVYTILPPRYESWTRNISFISIYIYIFAVVGEAQSQSERAVDHFLIPGIGLVPIPCYEERNSTDSQDSAYSSQEVINFLSF